MRMVVQALLVLIVAGLAGAAGYAFSKSQSTEYSATGELGFSRLVAPELQVLGADFSEPQVDADVRISTEAQNLNSFDVALTAARMFPGLRLNANQIAGGVSAAPVRGSLVVVVASTASTPRAAARLGSAYIKAYFKLRRVRERARAAVVEKALRNRLAVLPRAVKRGPIGATVRNQLSAIGVLKRVGSGTPEVIEEPQASAVATKPDTFRNTLFGLVLGLLVGVGLVALRAQARSRSAAVARARLSDLPVGR